MQINRPAHRIEYSVTIPSEDMFKEKHLCPLPFICQSTETMDYRGCYFHSNPVQEEGKECSHCASNKGRLPPRDSCYLLCSDNLTYGHFLAFVSVFYRVVTLSQQRQTQCLSFLTLCR